MTRENERQDELIQVLQSISTVSHRLAHNLSLFSATDTERGDEHIAVRKRAPLPANCRSCPCRHGCHS